MTGRTLRTGCALLLILAMSGCMVTRVKPPAPTPAPAQYKETGIWKHASGAETKVPDEWWTLFKDPLLDDLERRLVVGNENLKGLAAQVANARAVLDASRDVIWPTLSAGVSANRSSGAQSSSTGAQRAKNSVALSASSTWELDLWGRLWEASSGAQATLQATSLDLAAARLSAQATLAQTYLALRAADTQVALLERSVAGYQRSLELTQARYEGGVAMRSDVLQAQTQLKTTHVQRLDMMAQRAQLEHAIASLLGVPPSTLSIPRRADLPAPPAVPGMVPSTLLQRRPDIAAAQQRVIAAYAQIGVADAAFFPALSLTANGGYRNATFASLVSAPNLFWSIGPSLVEAILDGGQRKLASAQARAAADQATATYRQAVLTALQEVEDNLVLAEHLQAEAQLQEEALQYAQRNLEITLDQYKAGTVSYLNVVVAQNAAITSESNLITVRNRQLAAVNLLMKNIAGRWEITQAKSGANATAQ